MASKFTITLFVVFAIVSCCIIQDTTASHVSLYEHADHQGERWSATNFHGCRNVDGGFNDKASSVDTHNSCVELCEHGDCGGDCRRYAPGVNNHGHLGDFNDRTSSVRSC